MGNYEVRITLFLLIGVLLIIFPFIAPGLTPADEKGARLFFGGIGALFLLVGIGMFLFILLTNEHAVHLYEGGLCRDGDDKDREFRWEGIRRVLIREFSSSQGTLCVTVLGTGKRPLNFTTDFEGEPGRILSAIKNKVGDIEYEFVQ